MRYLLIFLMCVGLCWGATTIFTQVDDAGGGVYVWSEPNNWSEGIPIALDTVTIATGAICTLDLNLVPASGSLTEITNTGVSGQILVATGTRTIKATTITCAGSDDVIRVTGTASLTIEGNLVNTAAGTSDECVYFNSGGTLTITGNVTGGSGGSNNPGLHIFSSTATVVINGDVTGGSGAITNYGIDFNDSADVTVTGTVTPDVAGGMLVDTSKGGALVVGTLAYLDGKAQPVGGEWATYSFTSVTVNGTAIGGTGGGYRGRYN